MGKLILSEIRAAFESVANPANAVPMAAYIKNVAPFFGIKSPERKVMQRSIFEAGKELPFEDFTVLLRALFHEPERELHYCAMDWLYHRRKHWTADTLHIIGELIATKPWWDTVDFLAAHCLGEWVQRYPDVGRKVVLQYARSGKLWLERSAILHQLSYKTKTDSQLLEETILPHLASKEFFHQKAIGWALRQYARCNAEWVQRFVESHSLAALSRREAMKHL